MNKWSDELITLSRQLLNVNGIHVKSLDCKFGILNIDSKNKIYTISILGSDDILTYHSVDEIINAGWAVD